MSDNIAEIQRLEGVGYGSSKQAVVADIPSIEAFKRRFSRMLVTNKYIAEFSSSISSGKMWKNGSNQVKYMISSITLPQWLIDPETIYLGGASAMIPGGFQQNNIELTIYNTGPEFFSMKQWLDLTYNQGSRTYGWYDDVKADMTLTQYGTAGEKINVFTFTDCTIFQLGGLTFSYEPTTAPQTFNVSLNYFGWTMHTNISVATSTASVKDAAALAANKNRSGKKKG